jgi:hypothetical protein
MKLPGSARAGGRRNLEVAQQQATTPQPQQDPAINHPKMIADSFADACTDPLSLFAGPIDDESIVLKQRIGTPSGSAPQTNFMT